MKEVYIYTESTLPVYKNQLDRGADVKATSKKIKFVGGEPIIVYGTGVYVYSPDQLNIELRARSSVSTDTNLYLANGVGTIDGGYLGELKFAFALRGFVNQTLIPEIVHFEKDILTVIHQDGLEQTFMIYELEDRIGQLVIGEKGQVKFIEVTKEEFDSITTTRSQSGFGSTGKK